MMNLQVRMTGIIQQLIKLIQISKKKIFRLEKNKLFKKRINYCWINKFKKKRIKSKEKNKLIKHMFKWRKTYWMR